MASSPDKWRITYEVMRRPDALLINNDARRMVIPVYAKMRLRDLARLALLRILAWMQSEPVEPPTMMNP